MRFGFDPDKPPPGMGDIKDDALPDKMFPLKTEIEKFLNPNVTLTESDKKWTVPNQTLAKWNPQNDESKAEAAWGTWSTGWITLSPTSSFGFVTPCVVCQGTLPVPLSSMQLSQS